MHHLLVASRVVPGDDVRAPLPIRSGGHAQLGGSRPDHLGCFFGVFVNTHIPRIQGPGILRLISHSQ